VKVTIEKGTWVDPSRMTRAIQDSGFTPVEEEIHLTVSGTIEKQDGHFALALDGMKQPQSLTISGPEDAAMDQALSNNMGKQVQLEARWLQKTHPVLLVEKLEPKP
jgi:hypothetical protein